MLFYSNLFKLDIFCFLNRAKDDDAANLNEQKQLNKNYNDDYRQMQQEFENDGGDQNDFYDKLEFI